MLSLLFTQSCLTLCPHEVQHASLPCPSPSPGVCSNSYPLSHWCHPTILSFLTPFSSYTVDVKLIKSVLNLSFDQPQLYKIQFVCSVVSDSLQPHGLQHARPPCPSPTPGTYLLKLKSIESVMASNHLILRCPLFLLPSIFLSIRVFSNEAVLHIRWLKHWTFSIGPSNEYSRLISCRIDYSDLLAVHVTLKSLLQHHSSKASILLCSAFFIVQLSHPYTTTGKAIALTRRTFVGKVMSLFLICCIGWS